MTQRSWSGLCATCLAFPWGCWHCPQPSSDGHSAGRNRSWESRWVDPRDCHNVVYSLSMLCSVIRLLTIMTKTNTVMFLIHLSQGIEKPGWEHHEILGVWCCFLLTPLIFSSVSSSAGIEPSACYAWERTGWITFSRAQVVLRCHKTSMETKWGFNWANCWCLRPL